MVLHPSYRRSARRTSPWARSSSILPAADLLPDRTDATQIPSRRRPRRPTDRWLPLGNGSVLARITVFQHGGHQRPVIGRGAKHSRFRFASLKTRTTQLGEGKGEEWLAYFNEVSTQVADYECHPYRFDFVDRNGPFSYRPDTVRLFRNGRIEVGEVKRDEKDVRDPEYRERMAEVRELCRICGWDFNILYPRDTIGTETRRRNVMALFCRMSMGLTRQEEKVAGRLVANGSPIEWGDLRDRLAPSDPLQGDAVIECLLARGMLSTEIDARFTNATVLLPVRPFTGASEIRL